MISAPACENVSALGGTRTPNLLIRRVPLGVSDFLTCAGFRHFAWLGSRTPDFSGFSLADPLAACGLAPEPSSRLTGVNG
jgi:hypothetical protein